jgi:hypothetical protein
MDGSKTHETNSEGGSTNLCECEQSNCSSISLLETVKDK